MFKKILLPISAIAAMTLMACSGSSKSQVQTEPAANENANLTVSAAGAAEADANATGELTDEEIAAALALQRAAMEAQANGNGNAEKSSPIPAKCEIISESENSIHMVLTVPDSGKVTMEASLEGTTVKSISKLEFEPNISDEVIAKECEGMKSEEESVVTCEDRTITAVTTVNDPSVQYVYPMMVNQIKELCQSVQQTGFLNADEVSGGAKSSAEAPQAGVPLQGSCNMDMNSNVWTIKIESTNTTFTYEFTDKVTKISREVVANMGTPEMCAMAANAAAQDGGKIRCEGAVAYVSETEEEEGLTKEDVKSQFLPLCTQN